MPPLTLISLLISLALPVLALDTVLPPYYSPADASLEPVLPIVPYAGQTLDRCSVFTNPVCDGTRKCEQTDRTPCTPSSTCFCLPVQFSPCVRDSQCVNSEFCADVRFQVPRTCVSKDAKVLPIVSASTKVPQPPGDGRNLAPCVNDGQCEGGRQCSYIEVNPTKVVGCNGRQGCVCLTTGPEYCVGSGACERGEVCADVLSISRAPICVSKQAERDRLSVREVKVKGGGLTFDACKKDGDCRGKRKCQGLGGGNKFGDCKGGACVCLPENLRKCSNSDQCEVREVCVGTPFFDGDICVSVGARATFGGFVQNLNPIVCPTLIRKDPPVKKVNRQLRKMKKRRELETKVGIVGGLFANENLVDYMVAITSSTGVFLCTGSLLSEKWVLTAAHCNIREGYLVKRGRQVGSGGGIKVKEVFVHPQYRVTPEDFYYDVAVLELEQDVKDGKFVLLNADDKIPKDESAVRHIGYGLEGDFSGAKKGSLRQVDLQVIPHAECNAAYRGGNEAVSISRKLQVCANVRRGGCGSCTGDSGGPLFQYQGDTPVVVGTSSFGSVCGDWEFPNVFARTSALLKWIRGTGADFETNKGGGARRNIIQSV